MKIYWHNGSKNIIGKNLKKIRLERNLTQSDIAAALQLKGYEFDRITILRIENGLRFVPDYEVKILCEVLGVSYEDLLN
ncbi:MAG: XRE family transcriptional regulator [Clostridiales bacterium]|nr:XRE family transcriptional regulator [Clostridiales bacterium]MBD9010570.1 XRE family transcriptional regulator [Clostridiales bacterium]